MGGSKSLFKDCSQQSITSGTKNVTKFENNLRGVMAQISRQKKKINNMELDYKKVGNHRIKLGLNHSRQLGVTN